MKIKPKKCKSVNAKTSGHGCGKPTFKRTYGLCQMCYIDWLLKTPEGQKHLEQSKLTGKKKVRKEAEEVENAKFKKMKEDLKDYKKDLRVKIQEIARLIDIGLPCLARQNVVRYYDGGHVYGVGANQSMRYNLHNIHRQGKGSNKWQKDDLLMREGLVREYGQDYVDFLFSCKATLPLKFSRYQYMAFYKIACDIANDLKKKSISYCTKERIEMRNKINIELGIYHLKHSRYKNKN